MSIRIIKGLILMNHSMLKKGIISIFLCSMLIISFYNFCLNNQVISNLSSSDEQLNYNLPIEIDDYSLNPKLRLYYPRIGTPVIVLNGSWFLVKVTPDGTASDWNVSIVHPVVTYYLNIVSESTEGDMIILNVSVPDNAYNLLYDLNVSAVIDSNLEFVVEPNAVQVRYTISNTFKFVQITDTHIQASWSPSAEKTLQAVYQANLLNIDFIIWSGDIVEAPSDGSYKLTRSIMKQSQVPIFACGGNHDLDVSGTLSIYKKWIGLANYSIDYANFHIVAVDVSTPWTVHEDQVKFLEKNLNDTDPSKTILIFFHYPPFSDDGSLWLEGAATDFVKVIDKYNVSYILTGHIHRDLVVTVNDTVCITTSTTGSSFPSGYYNAYRYFIVENGAIVSFNYNNTTSRSIPLLEMPVQWFPSSASYENGTHIHIDNDLVNGFSFEFNVLVKNTSKQLIVKNATPLYTISTSSVILLHLAAEISSKGTLDVRVYPENPTTPEILDVIYPTNVSKYESFIVYAKVKNTRSGIDMGKVKYRLNNGSWQYDLMSKINDTTLRYIFDGLPAGTNITFSVIVWDYSGLSAQSPEYVIHVAPEEQEQPQPPPQPPSNQTEGPSGFQLDFVTIGGLVAGVVIIVIVVLIFLKRRR